MWGTGIRTKGFIDQGYFEDCEVIAIVDSFSGHKDFMGYSMIRPSQVVDYIDEVDYVVITNSFYLEITQNIVELGISLDKVIITDNAMDPPYRQCFEKTKEILPSIYEAMKNCLVKTVKLNERDFSDTSTIFGDERISNIESTAMFYIRWKYSIPQA